MDLGDNEIKFQVSFLGESTHDVPEIISTTYEKLKNTGILSKWGYLESKDAYWEELIESDVVVSTANHEFFGVSVMEAISVGCVPLCPNRLVYPELISTESKKIFEGGCLYNTDVQLTKRLYKWACRPNRIRKAMISCLELDFEDGILLKKPFLLKGLEGELANDYEKLFTV